MNPSVPNGPLWPAGWSPNARRSLLWALAFTAAGLLIGAFSPLRPLTVREQAATDLAVGLLGVIMIYTWCRAEALERRRVPSGRFALWAAILPPVFVPVYLLRTRPWQQALRHGGVALAYFIGVNLLQMLSTAAVLALRTDVLQGA